MSRYVITITRLDAGGGSDGGTPQAIIRVKTDDGQAYLEEVTMRASEGAALAPGQVPPVDLTMLVRAFAHRPDLAPAIEADALVARPVAPIRIRRTTTDRRTKRSRIPATGVDWNSSGGAASMDRAYRRMPDVATLRAVYAQTHTITGLAAHFGVPRHTAQGWVTRLRNKGIALADS